MFMQKSNFNIELEISTISIFHTQNIKSHCEHNQKNFSREFQKVTLENLTYYVECKTKNFSNWTFSEFFSRHDHCGLKSCRRWVWKCNSNKLSAADYYYMVLYIWLHFFSFAFYFKWFEIIDWSVQFCLDRTETTYRKQNLRWEMFFYYLQYSKVLFLWTGLISNWPF